MTTGGLESTMAREDYSPPTMCSWMSERRVKSGCVNSSGPLNKQTGLHV